MLQSSGKVTRKKVRPVSKVSNQKTSSHQSNDPIHTTSANRQTSNNNSGASPVNKSGGSSVMLPAEVEQIFEVSLCVSVIYATMFVLYKMGKIDFTVFIAFLTLQHLMCCNKYFSHVWTFHKYDALWHCRLTVNLVSCIITQPRPVKLQRRQPPAVTS